MYYWVASTNGTVSGPFTKREAKAEHARLLHLANGAGAADLRIVCADSIEAVRAYMKEPWI